MLEIRPIVIDENNIVLGGNMRLRAVKELGYKDVPVVLASDLTDEQKKEFIIKDNLPFGDWDWDILANEWDSVNLAEWGMDLPADFIKEPEERDAEPQIDKAEELNKKWKVKTGDLWLIGEHRLLCGDSVKDSDVSRIFDIECNVCVTDPPYGVDYDANWRNEAAEKGLLSYSASRVGVVQNDTNDDWRAAWSLFKGNVIYVWHADRRASKVQESIESVGFEIRAQIIWEKPHFVIGRGHYTPRHEPCWYGVRKGKTASWIGEKMQDTLWRVSLDKNVSGGHSTQKPLMCMSTPIKNHSGDIYDPFLGSGTTMVACQNLNRKCRGIEISPSYCAVILERMQTAFPELEIKREG